MKIESLIIINLCIKNGHLIEIKQVKKLVRKKYLNLYQVGKKKKLKIIKIN